MAIAGALLVLTASVAHATPEEAPLTAAETSKHACVEAVSKALASRLAGEPLFAGTDTDPAPEAADAEQMQTFYAARENAPLWSNGYVLNNRAHAAMREIRTAAKYGLDETAYPLPGTVEKVKDGWLTKPCGDPEILAAAELRLTATALTYARHARGGRIDLTKVSRDVDRKGEIVPPAEVLEALATETDPGEYLKGLHPSHKQYGYLMKALALERAKVKAAKDNRFPDGPLLRRGVKHPHVALLRDRLIQLKFAKPQKSGKAAKNPELFDRKLDRAVRAFQRKHRLKADGMVGTNTKAAFSGFRKRDLNAILVNLERWRQMPPSLGRKYIGVNVPEYKLRVVKNGKIVHEERTVVGKPQNRTPIFSDMLEKVVFNPYWNVPKSIYLDEWGGRLPRGFSAKRYGKTWIVRQPPGPRNALGKIKFIFPNHHSVYMHDTPKKKLFKRKVRAFSHGCVRVRNPKRLAQVIMRDEEGWNSKRVDRFYHSRKNKPVRLAEAVPVHVTYFTAWADENGKLKVFDDVYGHDRRVAGALKYAPPAPPDVRKRKIRRRKRGSVMVATYSQRKVRAAKKKRRVRRAQSQYRSGGGGGNYFRAVKPAPRVKKRSKKRRKRRAPKRYYYGGYNPWYMGAFGGY